MTADSENFVQMGVAARIHSLEFAIQHLQADLAEHRAMLARLQANGAAESEPRRGGWAGMTPEERSAEMKRRRSVQLANAARGPKLPYMVGEKYTVTGAAHELGLSHGGFEYFMRTSGAPKGSKAKIPGQGRHDVRIWTRAEVEAMRRLREKAAA